MNVKVYGRPGTRECRGVIKSVDVYNDILLGKTDWSDVDKKRITDYQLPAAVFTRLLELDKATLQHDVEREATTQLLNRMLDDLAAAIHADESDFVSEAIEDIRAKYLRKVVGCGTD